MFPETKSEGTSKFRGKTKLFPKGPVKKFFVIQLEFSVKSNKARSESK